ncbi:hypothetical protein SMACR_07115 [Sordaria macrospora]|uniref:WGS project CABT00000000 data, contig 2.39 n=2 Tax=Sordaria macrospora TaxID=5147 RepID=F7W7K7_SORMK|nr:uncharacterized protein SMAC_07115 [Sordaria macrospora k-hell]KAA8633458.1 hypothetical protein SMACR_07115 [Sordaria macrospora]KAH7630246.1 hypothetical protein B0T09DRAFT_374440 [Sordaria sp. MPI-SDFR-AT-0083]WPJ66916.1 hypothetical protein SMAC4_07115 [Sordaria macrospora]CCC13491.1 unnamed protein product [Sordaria macrospora k-hell]
MDQASPDTPLLGSPSSPKKKPGLNASLILDPSSPASPPSETEYYLTVEDSDSNDDDDDDNNDNSSDTNTSRPTKRYGMSASLVMLTRLLLFVLILSNLITWSVVGWLSKNPFVILSYIELVFMLMREENNNRPASSGSNLDDLRIPRISLVVGDWSCELGGKELFAGFGGFGGKKWAWAWVGDDVCAFYTALWWDMDDWTAPLIIGYVVGGFQLLAVVLDQVKPLGRRTTIEVAFHGVGPVRKDRYIQLPVDAEAAVPPMSITV